MPVSLFCPTGIPVGKCVARPPFGPTIKRAVQQFWQNSPCDSWFTTEPPGTPAFYRALDDHRYQLHPRLCTSVQFERTSGLRVLEIGCGCGSEAERFARAGAHYIAVDLTNAAVSITKKRFGLSMLNGGFTQGDAENLPFCDRAFDFVYSHGVLHHTPDTAQAIREIYRVLTPGGRAVVMLYYRNSFNYQVNLKVLRRMRMVLLKSKLGVQLAGKLWNESLKDLERHAELVRKDPEYSDMSNMLNRNTDGPDNPLSQVFSKVEARRMFHQFGSVRMEVMFWNPRWLPILGKLLPRWPEDQLASLYGWHLWIFAQKSYLETARARQIPRLTLGRIKLHAGSEASVA
ncbi:MAG TPA: class I SAM-dependent methyltransferase [Terriglobales bacterium]|nr:class I SAM-dependent methyltransferase [Terriglobales bacterium]